MPQTLVLPQQKSCLTAGMGEMYAKLIASGSVDERTALMLFLLVEKLRGR